MTDKIHEQIAKLMGFENIDAALIENVDLFDEEDQHFIKKINAPGEKRQPA